MFYFYHFQTLSGKISAFWHILYGKSVKKAFFMSNGKKRFCLEKLTFFHHHPALSWKYSGFCITFFLRASQKCIFAGQNQKLEEKHFFPETFSHHCHTLSEKTSAFLRNLLRLTAKSALYVSNGFVEYLKAKTSSEKVFFTSFVDLERKKLGFCWLFSGVGSKFAIIVAANKIWVRKFTFPKLLFDNFCTMTFNVRPSGEN